MSLKPSTRTLINLAKHRRSMSKKGVMPENQSRILLADNLKRERRRLKKVHGSEKSGSKAFREFNHGVARSAHIK